MVYIYIYNNVCYLCILLGLRVEDTDVPASCASRTLGIQIAQCRYYLQTLGPNVGIIHILGSLGGVHHLKPRLLSDSKVGTVDH